MIDHDVGIDPDQDVVCARSGVARHEQLLPGDRSGRSARGLVERLFQDDEVVAVPCRVSLPVRKGEATPRSLIAFAPNDGDNRFPFHVQEIPAWNACLRSSIITIYGTIDPSKSDSVNTLCAI